MTASNHPINPHRRRLAWAMALAASPFSLAACGGGSSSGGSISITGQPVSLEVTAGQTATFSVTAVGTGTGALNYQWQRNGVDVAGATASTYSVVAQRADSGAVFSVVVSANGVTVSSQGAVLTVNSGTMAYFWKNPGAGISPSLPMAVNAAGQVFTVLQAGSPARNQAGPTLSRITASGEVTSLYTLAPYRTEIYQQSNLYGALAVGSAGELNFVRLDAVATFDIFYSAQLNLQTLSAGTPGPVRNLLDSAGVPRYTDQLGYAKTTALAMDAAGGKFYAAGFQRYDRFPTVYIPTVLLCDATGRIQQETAVPAAWQINALALDSAGRLHALASVGASTASARGQIVARLASTGDWVIVAGSATQSGYLDGAGASALFGSVDSLAFDKNNHLFIADAANHLIRRLDAQTGVVSTVAGTPGVAATRVGTLPGALQSPNGLCFDASGALYALSGIDIVKLSLPT